MKYLLDTHTFIWWNAQSNQLPAKVFTLLKDHSNTVMLSLASIWEMQIKLQSGKLTLPASLPHILEVQQHTNRLELLPITLPHILALDQLPTHHKDPFDRIIIAQASVEGITVISHDPMFSQYAVAVLW